MLELRRARLAIKYIFFEMLPTFILGILVFLLIILMFQSFRLTEYVIVHGASVPTIGRILGYLAISFLPGIFPMSLLFTVLLTYGRLSGDSEVVAFKALGLNIKHLAVPAVVLGLLTAIISAQTSFQLAPWGNRRMEVLIHQLGQSKPGATIREGVFSEGFFDLVVYANEVDSKEGRLHKVFIYDEREPNSPLTIIAKEGRLVEASDVQGNKAFLRLIDGNIHRAANDMYTRIDFDSYDINLFDPVSFTEKHKSPQSHTLQDINQALGDSKLPEKNRLSLLIEYHRRGAISVACLIFAVLGVGLGTTTNRRASKSSGFVISLGVIVSYWLVYAGLENLAKSGHIPVGIAIWSANIAFGALSLYSVRKAAN